MSYTAFYLLFRNIIDLLFIIIQLHMNYVSACIAKEKACDNNNIDKTVNKMGNGINIFSCHLDWKCFPVKFWIKVESFP